MAVSKPRLYSLLSGKPQEKPPESRDTSKSQVVSCFAFLFHFSVFGFSVKFASACIMLRFDIGVEVV
jgi:hypothetical protein